MVKRLAGLSLAIVGAAVAVHFVLDPLIYEWAEGDGTPVAWIILDWLMALGLAIALWVTFEAKRAADAGTDLREYLIANTQFYLAAALALLLVWNAVQIDWAAGDQTPDGQVWVVIDVLAPLLFVTLGLRLWNES
ncbi:MAG: hypothetical protein F4056_06580 [Chloroflexi bacterium]|nr:hypothetical protein [Chloroflexota bacterium]